MSRATRYILHWLRMGYGFACDVLFRAFPRWAINQRSGHVLGWMGYYALYPEPRWQPMIDQERASRKAVGG